MDDATRFWKRLGGLGLLVLVYALAILAVLWPWPHYFVHGFPDHFDPPFHTWKLQWVGLNIWKGHLLPPAYSTNAMYPNGCTLFYEALHWPQAVGAGLIILLTGNPMLAYNSMFLFWWAFSGACMFLFLRELRVDRWLAVVGGLVFCLLPYRVSYYVEFNMQLCAGLVLVLLFMLRFMREPGWLNATGLAIAFWLQATSELYQALILTICLPVLVLALLRIWWTRYRSSVRFHAWVVYAGLLTAVICWPFLMPYHDLQSQGFARSAKDMGHHSLEPLSYLAKGTNRSSIFNFPVREDEMVVYPTLALLALAGLYAYRTRRIFRTRDRSQPCSRMECIRIGLAGIRFFACVVLVASIFTMAFGEAHAVHLWMGWRWVLNLSFLAALGSSIALLPVAEDTAGEDDFLRGLGTAALLAFIMSIGPSLGVGYHEWVCRNLIFQWLCKATPLVSGMRVVSRFSLIPQIFLVAVGAKTAQGMIGHWPRGRRGLVTGLWLALFLWDGHLRPPSYRIEEYPLKSTALAAIPDSTPPPVCVVLPIGHREWDSRYMLKVGRADRLLINGWAGFFPEITLAITHDFGVNDLTNAIRRVAEIWPTPYVIIDKPALALVSRKEASPLHHEQISDMLPLVAKDETYAVYSAAVSNTPAAATYERLIRGDMLRQYSSLSCTINLPDGGSGSNQAIVVLVNSHILDLIDVNAGHTGIHVAIPPAFIQNVYPNSVRLVTLGGQRFQVTDFVMQPLDDTARVSAQLARHGKIREQIQGQSQSWTPHTVMTLPGDVTGEPAGFDNGMVLAGVQMARHVVPSGAAFQMDWYWRNGVPVKNSASCKVFVHFMKDGQIIFQDDHRLLSDVEPSSWTTDLGDDIFCEERTVIVPATATPGTYTVECGILDENTGERLVVHSKNPTHHRAVELPFQVEVTPVK